MTPGIPRRRVPMRWPLLGSIVVALALLALCPIVALADGSSLRQIDQAIKEKGYGWTPREYKRDFATGLMMTEKSMDDEAPASESLKPLVALPSMLDWRDNGGNYVSDVRDQGSCGACWSFASIAALESHYAIANQISASTLDLSEQILVSCDPQNRDDPNPVDRFYGCSGGDLGLAADFLQSSGTYYESCSPYVGADTACSTSCADWRVNGEAFKVTGYQRVYRTLDELRLALQHGPIQLGFNVFDDFYFYGGGVYQYASGSYTGGHAVLAVGYKDTPETLEQDGGGFFIVKNSWGTSWGDFAQDADAVGPGYFRIGYSQVTTSVRFGMAAYRFTGVTGPVTEPPTPTPTPTPAPTPTPPAPVTMSRSLALGWNLVSLSVAPASVAPADVLQTISGKFDMVFTLDTATGAKQYYIPSQPSSTTLTVLDEKGPFWIRMTSAATLTVTGAPPVSTTQSLVPGWSIISYPSNTQRNVADVMRPLDGKYSAVIEYNPATSKKWNVYGPSYPPYVNTLSVLRSGYGYYVKMTASASLTIAN